MTLDLARLLWCTLADAPVAFPPSGVSVAVSPSSRLCPPGWCGVIALGPSAIATVPTASLKPAVEAALSDLPTADDAGESGLDEITSPAFVLSQDGLVVAAAGYRRWPTGVAHLSVLTAPSHRGRGLAHTVAGHAVADALSHGLFPQWRARPLASRRVARALGFHELGSQLSFEVS
jgi:GNAT superfamily N-acetyltransferase